MMANVRPTAGVVVRAGDRPLFALYHEPVGAARNVAVVMCPPLGYEALAAYRTYRHAAERLAGQGFHVLRFDYYGTGNSAGQSSEAHDLCGDIHAAIEHLKTMTGMQKVCLFGIRAGALLAAAVATQRQDVAGLVLVAAPVSGRAMVRELKAFHAMSGASNGGFAEQQDGVVNIGGFDYSQSMLDELQSINLLKLDFSRVLRELIIARDDMPDDGKLMLHCSETGCLVRQVATKGYAAMMTIVESSIVPHTLLNHLQEWMEEFPRSTDSLPVSLTEEHSLMSLQFADVTIRERAVWFGPQKHLFGVLTEQYREVERRSRRAVLLLSVGANHHIGTGRNYVVMARELAAQGLVVLRFDVSGLGESHATPGKDENVIYDPDSIADVTHAMAFLSNTCKVEGFILAGVCLGAHLAFYAPPVQKQIVGRILVNWAVFEMQPPVEIRFRRAASFKSRESYIRAIFELSTWRRMIKGEVAVFSIAKYLVAHAWTLMVSSVKHRLFLLLGTDASVNSVEREMKAILRKGVPTWLVYSEGDPALDALQLYLGMDGSRVRSYTCFDMRRVPGADHAFSRPVAQLALRKIMREFVEITSPRRRYERSRGAHAEQG
jgi:alpha/beta superfamily hydrolase